MSSFHNCGLAAMKSFNVKETPDVIAKVPKITEQFFNNITVRWEATDAGEVTATASISLDTAAFRKALVNEGIGAGDGAETFKHAFTGIIERHFLRSFYFAGINDDQTVEIISGSLTILEQEKLQFSAINA